MRALIIAIILAGAASPALAQPALAQVERLPETSRAERQTQDINRSIMLQEQQMRQNQQTQFEVNQLRNEIQQSRQFPSVTGPGVGSCPAGSIC